MIYEDTIKEDQLIRNFHKEVDETELNNKVLTLFPNPNNGNFRIILPKNNYKGILTITDIQGLTVFTKSTDSKSELAISLPEVAAGFYFVRWITEEQTYITKATFAISQ